MMKLLIFGFIFYFVPGVFAQGDESSQEPIVTYGELLVKEQASDFHKNLISINIGYESGNPLFDVYNYSFSYSRNISNYFEVGLIARTYSAKKTALLESVQQNFGLLGVGINSEVPQKSYYLVAGVIPLKGRLNFFGLTILPYQWVFSLGVGERETEVGKYFGYMWAIESRLLITDSLGLVISYNQEAEAAFESSQTVTRNQINVGILYGF